MAGAQPTVLIVDDDSKLRAMLKRLLELDGYTVEVAADGPEGLAHVEAGGISLVLLDLVLPGMSGLQLCQHVRERETEVYLPIIMVTGLRTEVDRRAGFAAGASDYIVKPYKPADLRDRVKVWMRTRRYLEAAHERQQGGEQETLVGGPESALALACATNHELTRLLGLLLVLAELWEAGTYSAGDVARIRVELGSSARELATRINTLNSLARRAPQGRIRPATSSP